MAIGSDTRRIVHISDVLQYKACRRKWWFSSPIGRNLTPKQLYAPFFVGSAVHHCKEHLTIEGASITSSLAAFLKTELKDHVKGPMWQDEVPAIRKDVRLVRALMDQYIAWSRTNKGPFGDQNLDYIAHEVRFDDGPDADWPAVRLEIDGVPLQPEVWLAGRFDGLVRRRSDGSIWLTEDKTCRSIEERSKLLPHDEQATAYVYAASTLFNEPVTGIVYTLLRKKVAEVPRPVKGGRLSVDKRIDTSPEIYRQAILEYHGRLSEQKIQAEYGSVLQYIEDFREPFVARVAIKRTQTQINRYIRELHATALEMFSPNTYITATRTWSCPGCLFRAPCLAMDIEEDDSGALQILSSQFKQRNQADRIRTIAIEDIK